MPQFSIPQAYELAVDHYRAGRFGQAEALYRQILALRPDIVEVHNNLGVLLADQERRDEALAAYRQALALRPGFAEAWNNLGNTLRKSGAITEAIAAFGNAIAAAPDFATAFQNLGLALEDQFQTDHAAAAYRRVVELRPKDPHAHYNLANALRDLCQLDAAIDAYQAAIALRPDYVEAHHNLAGVLKDTGRLDDALAAFDRALQLRPNAFTAGNALYTLHFHPDYDARRLAHAHADWNRRYARPLAPRSLDHPNSRDPNRRLRIGYVSPDMREHPVGRFLLPLLSHHDRAKFEVFCYTDVRRTDVLTAQLRAQVNIWQTTSNLSDEQLAALIRQDQIDILIDLTMHLKGARLLTFARKPAPVQVTYLAYCGTTGLETMDYRLSDPYLDPPSTPSTGSGQAPGIDESVYSEKTIRLPRTYWCYPRPEAAPALAAPPAGQSRHITFGCLNNFCKITPQTLSIWRDLLVRVPDSRLILHALEGRHRQHALDYFAEASVDPQRIEFVGLLSLGEYLWQYQRIDIALDPFPYGGGTTTCDALYMGVPVITLAGDTAVSRGGSSILSNIGHPQLIARSSEQYLHIAVNLAADPDELAHLRSALRRQMESSPLMDAVTFARDVEAAFRAMWCDWCASRPS